MVFFPRRPALGLSHSKLSWSHRRSRRPISNGLLLCSRWSKSSGTTAVSSLTGATYRKRHARVHDEIRITADMNQFDLLTKLPFADQCRRLADAPGVRHLEPLYQVAQGTWCITPRLRL